jgi:hypothetical protein
MQIKESLRALEDQALTVQGAVRALDIVMDAVQSAPADLKARHAASMLMQRLAEDMDGLCSGIGDLMLSANR